MPAVALRSSACHIHMPLCRRRFEMKIMRTRFGPQRTINRHVDRIRIAAAQGRAQIHMVIMAKTHIKLPRSRHPNAITPFTEILCKWGDQAQFAVRAAY